MEKNSCNILIVEDDEVACRCLKDAFLDLGQVTTAGSVEEFKTKLSEAMTPDVVILDAVFPKQAGAKETFQAPAVVEGLEKVCSDRNDEWPAIILISNQNNPTPWFGTITGWLENGTIRDVLPKSAMNMGWKFFTLILQRKVERIRSEQRNRQVVQSYNDAVASLRRFGIVTTDPDLAGRLWRQIDQAARLGLNVYIYGERGTGKELIAKAIRDIRGREKGYSAVNCADYSSSSELCASQIFGHVKGAFTGADTERAGAIQTAGRGVLFLDEITKAPLAHANKLLRALEPQTREYTKMGSDKTLTVECVVVTAGQEPILRAVAKGFSAELADRITELEIRLPPLRDRRGDISGLIKYFWEKYRQSTALILDDDLTQRLCKGQWPGNVRQLEKFLKRLAAEQYDQNRCTVTLQDAVRLSPPNKEEDLGSIVAELVDPVSTPTQGSDSSFSELLAKSDDLKVRLHTELAYTEPTTWQQLASWSDDNASEKAILAILGPLLSDAGGERLSALQGQHRQAQKVIKAKDNDKPPVLSNNPAKINLYCAITYLALSPKESRTITKSKLRNLTRLGQAQAGYVLNPLAGSQFVSQSDGKVAEQASQGGGDEGDDDKSWQFIRRTPEKKGGSKEQVFEICEGLLR